MNYTIWLTASCNLCCKYCYEGNNKLNLMLDKKTANDILYFIRKDLKEDAYSELTIDFHGGEPFMNFEMMQYLVDKILEEYDKERKVIFGTTTNATIMNEEILRFIIKYIPDITVSLDGTKKIHDYLRPYQSGAGSYDVAMKNSMKILKKLPDIRVRMTVNVDLVKNLAEGVRNLVEHGFKNIVPALDLFDNRWNDDLLQELESQIREIKKYIEEKKNVAVSLCEPLTLKCHSICSGGIKSKIIYPDGSIYPCMMAGGISEFKIGNIYSGIANDKLAKVLAYNEQLYSECRECALANSCNGKRCKIINRLVTGDFILPSSVECQLNHLLYKINGIECYA